MCDYHGVMTKERPITPEYSDAEMVMIEKLRKNSEDPEAREEFLAWLDKVMDNAEAYRLPEGHVWVMQTEIRLFRAAGLGRLERAKTWDALYIARKQGLTRLIPALERDWENIKDKFPAEEDEEPL